MQRAPYALLKQTLNTCLSDGVMPLASDAVGRIKAGVSALSLSKQQLLQRAVSHSQAGCSTDSRSRHSCCTAIAGFRQAAWLSRGKSAEAVIPRGAAGAHLCLQRACLTAREQPACMRGYAQFAAELQDGKRGESFDEFMRRNRILPEKPTKGLAAVELFPSGAIIEHTARLSSQELGIHPRDMPLFAVESKLAPQRATITVRNGKVLLRTEAMGALISTNNAFIFRTRHSVRDYRDVMEHLAHAVRRVKDMPFELNVLEVLLHQTTIYFCRRINHIDWMMKSVIKDLDAHNEPFTTVCSESLIQQLVPLEKALTSVRVDAQETCEALNGVLEDEDLLSAICLSGDQEMSHDHEVKGEGAAMRVRELVTTNKDHAQRVLEAYERDMEAVSSRIFEMEENLDTTREMFKMKLDSARNHIILLNLKLSLASIGLMVCAVVPTFFGMNVNHGLPDEPVVFFSIAIMSLAAAVASYPMTMKFYKKMWATQSTDELNKVNTLRQFLMQHLDDLDDIYEACKTIKGRVDIHGFKAHMKEQLPMLNISPTSLNFLFYNYDANRDGFFEAVELQLRHDNTNNGWRRVPPQLLAAAHGGSDSDDEHDDKKGRIGSGSGSGGDAADVQVNPEGVASDWEPWFQYARSEGQGQQQKGQQPQPEGQQQQQRSQSTAAAIQPGNQ